MKKILTITAKINNNKYIGKDALNRSFQIVSPIGNLVIGNSVLTHNLSVVGKVDKAKLQTFEV